MSGRRASAPWPVGSPPQCLPTAQWSTVAGPYEDPGDGGSPLGVGSSMHALYRVQGSVAKFQTSATATPTAWSTASRLLPLGCAPNPVHAFASTRASLIFSSPMSRTWELDPLPGAPFGRPSALRSGSNGRSRLPRILRHPTEQAQGWRRKRREGFKPARWVEADLRDRSTARKVAGAVRWRYRGGSKSSGGS
jgi:hypothetical protein